jgi:predicted dehydrogenase
MGRAPSKAVRSHPALRLGILGCANIARQFARDVLGSPAVELVAVASRDAGKAKAFAADFGIRRAHGSYEALLDDKGVDAIYNPLPNSLHAQWTIQAARSGKHVLCEKPLCMSRSQAVDVFDAAKAQGVFVLEAYPYWFQPATAMLLNALQDIGPVRSMQAFFGFNLAAGSDNIRWKPTLGGGALWDAGSYTVSLTRLVMGTAPQKVQAHATWTDDGVDRSTSAQLLFADGRCAQVQCAMDTAFIRHAVIQGAKGSIVTDFQNHNGDGTPSTHGYRQASLRVRRGTTVSTPFEDLPLPMGSGFRFAAEAFARKVAERDTTAFGLASQASIDIATTLEAISLAARTKQVVSLASVIAHGD